MIKQNTSSPIFTPSNRAERIWKIAQVDFKKRFYNDKFGLLWALLNPLTQIALYYFVFTIILKRGEDNYVLFLFCGIMIWLAFSQATTMGLRVIISKIHLIESVQFNWLDLYISHMISVLMGLLFNIVAYLILLLAFGAKLGGHFYLIPIVLLTWYLITGGISIILGLIRPIFEDIAHIWSLLLMVGFWVSGIFFSGTYFLSEHTWFSIVNPFIGLILNFRSCLLEGNEISFFLLWINLLSGVCIYIIAVLLFNKYAKKVTEQL